MTCEGQHDGPGWTQVSINPPLLSGSFRGFEKRLPCQVMKGFPGFRWTQLDAPCSGAVKLETGGLVSLGWWDGKFEQWGESGWSQSL